MRLKAIGIGAAGILAAGAFTVIGGVHHLSVSASPCSAGTAPTGPYVGSQIGGSATAVGVGSSFGCVEVGADTSSGVVYSPVTALGQVGKGGLLGVSVPGVYVIAQGSQNAPVAQGQGYVGVSNYDTGSTQPGANDPPCGSVQSGGGSNGGGAIVLDPLCPGQEPTSAVIYENNSGEIFVANMDSGLRLVAPVACGHVSGNDWGNTGRDGCGEP